jgi:hypothetical protein
MPPFVQILGGERRLFSPRTGPEIPALWRNPPDRYFAERDFKAHFAWRQPVTRTRDTSKNHPV